MIIACLAIAVVVLVSCVGLPLLTGGILAPTTDDDGGTRAIVIAVLALVVVALIGCWVLMARASAFAARLDGTVLETRGVVARRRRDLARADVRVEAVGEGWSLLVAEPEKRIVRLPLYRSRLRGGDHRLDILPAYQLRALAAAIGDRPTADSATTHSATAQLADLARLSEQIAPLIRH